MIASLRGKVESFSADGAVINVGGIGFQVFMPTSTLSALGAIDSEVKLYTHLHLREDNVALYGFSTAAELSLFQSLLGVTGLGPRLALAMLSGMSAEALVTAITTGSTELLTAIPGIGKKAAERIVLELKEKLGAGWVSTAAPGVARENAEVLAALTSLGYSASEAARAVAALPADDGANLEEKIRRALAYFGGK